MDLVTYFVSSKINRGAKDLDRAEFKALFLDFVGIAKKKFRFKLWNFCIMGDSIYFLIKPEGEASLSEIMQWIKCNFAKKWNRLHNTSGHLWGDRFYSRIIEDKDLRDTSAFIDNIPTTALERLFSGLSHLLRGITWLIDALPDGWPQGIVMG
jgi:putative transposase